MKSKMQSLYSEKTEKKLLLNSFLSSLSQFLGPRTKFAVMSDLEVTKDFDKLWLAWEPQSTRKTFLFVFKSLLNLLQYCLFFFNVLVFWLQVMWDLTSPTRDGNHLPWTERQSPNQWTAGKSQEGRLWWVTSYWHTHFIYNSSIQRTLSVLSSYVCFSFCPLTWIPVLHLPLFHTETQDFNSRPFDWWIKKHYLRDFPYFSCLFFREMTLSISLIHLIIILTWYDKITYIWNHSYSNYWSIQGSNSHLLCHLVCRWILYPLNHQGSPPSIYSIRFKK